MTERGAICEDTPTAAGGMAWFVVQVRPNAQDMAKRNLTRQGFEVFAPFEESVRRSGQRYVVRRSLLFPGYIFVRCTAEGQNWRAINGTTGVSRLIAFAAGPPAHVPDALIAAVQARCDANGKISALDDLQPGERVRIVGGPFSDFVATVEKTAARERIWVLLNVLGVETRVVLGRHDVRKGG